MGLPYSTRFIAAALNSPSTATYVVPAGKLAIVKDVTYTCGATSGGGATTGLSTSVLFFTSSNIPAYATAHWFGHQVFNPGETIESQVFAGGVFVMVSGYLLTLNPP